MTRVLLQDSELRRIQEQKNSGATGKLPPVRNSRGKEKKVQIGPSDIEKQKAEKGAAKKMEDGMSKNQKYYQYDYFKVRHAPNSFPWLKPRR